MTNERSDDSLQVRVRERFHLLTRSEQKVARYLSDHSQDVILATAGALGKSTGTSDATVVRTVQALGYAGLPELKSQMGQDMIAMIRPDRRLRHRIQAVGSDAQSIVNHVFAESAERLHETARLLSPEDVSRAAALIHKADFVLVAGVGPSASVASYFALRLGRIGRRAHVTSLTGFGLADDLLLVRSGDVIVLYVMGRVYNDIYVILDHAKVVGAHVVLIAEGLAIQLAGTVDAMLQAVQSPSGLTGSPLPAFAVTDVLLLSVAATDEDYAAGASETLNTLRAAITGWLPAEAPRRA